MEGLSSPVRRWRFDSRGRRTAETCGTSRVRSENSEQNMQLLLPALINFCCASFFGLELLRDIVTEWRQGNYISNVFVCCSEHCRVFRSFYFAVEITARVVLNILVFCKTYQLLGQSILGCFSVNFVAFYRHQTQQIMIAHMYMRYIIKCKYKIIFENTKFPGLNDNNRKAQHNLPSRISLKPYSCFQKEMF